MAQLRQDEGAKDYCKTVHWRGKGGSEKWFYMRFVFKSQSDRPMVLSAAVTVDMLQVLFVFTHVKSDSHFPVPFLLVLHNNYKWGKGDAP